MILQYLCRHIRQSLSHMKNFFNTPPSTLLGWFLYICSHAVSGKEDQRTPVFKWLLTAFSTIFRRNFIRLIVLNDLVKVTSLPPDLEMNGTLTLLHFLGITKSLNDYFYLYYISCPFYRHWVRCHLLLCT